MATPAGEVLAYIKFATRPGAIQAIEHEARLTAHVAGLRLTSGAVPPPTTSRRGRR